MDTYFSPVHLDRFLDGHISKTTMEDDVRDFWSRIDLSKLQDKLSQGQRVWSTADAPLQLSALTLSRAQGHIHRDICTRYAQMVGYRVVSNLAIDTFSPLIETRLRALSSVNSGSSIPRDKRDEFLCSCLKMGNDREKDIAEDFKQLGLTLRDPYNTHMIHLSSPTHIQTVWSFLKECRRKGFLKKLKTAVAWCSNCQQGTDSYELPKQFTRYKDAGVYVRFPVKGAQNTYLLCYVPKVWTLLGHVAIAVRESHSYCVIKQENNFYILSKDCVQNVFGPNCIIEKDMSAAMLVSCKYESPYREECALPEGRVVVTNLSKSMDINYTGLEAICPCASQRELEVAEGFGLKIPELFDAELKMKYGPFKGQLCKGKAENDINSNIRNFLWSNRNFFLRQQEDFLDSHSCPRCASALGVYLLDDWVLSSVTPRTEVFKNLRKIAWHNEALRERSSSLIRQCKNMPIRQKQAFGVPIPIWECKCGQISLIGHKSELTSRAVNPEKVDSLLNVDEVKIACDYCRSPTTRISGTVANWINRAVLPFSNSFYINRSTSENWKTASEATGLFPIDVMFDSESKFKNSFFYNTYAGTILENTPAITAAFAFQEEVTPPVNEPDYRTWINQVGTDITRCFFALQEPNKTIVNIDWLTVNNWSELLRKFCVFCRSIKDNNQETIVESLSPMPSNYFDRWIYARVEYVLDSLTVQFDKLRTWNALPVIHDLIADVVLWWLQFRLNMPLNELWTHSYFIGKKICLMLAPFVPYLAEFLWQTIFRNVRPGNAISIHCELLPKAKINHNDDAAILEVSILQQVINVLNTLRAKKAIHHRIRLPRAFINVGNVCQRDTISRFYDLILKNTNIDNIQFVGKPHVSDEVNCIMASSDTMRIWLDTNIKGDFLHENTLMEIKRIIQELRSNNKIPDETLINVYIKGPLYLRYVLEDHHIQLKEASKIFAIQLADIPEYAPSKDVVIHGSERITIGIFPEIYGVG